MRGRSRAVPPLLGEAAGLTYPRGQRNASQLIAVMTDGVQVVITRAPAVT